MIRKQVLRPLEPGHLTHLWVQRLLLWPGSSPVSAATVLRRQYRRQLFTAMARYPDDKSELVMCANCPPAGFRTYPSTYACHRSLICPWCYVRDRFMPVHNAVYAFVAAGVPFDFYATIDDVDLLPPSGWFYPYRTRKSPHVRNSALCTIQTLTYDLSKPRRGPGLSRVMLQLLPVGAVATPCATPENVRTYARPSVVALSQPSSQEIDTALVALFRLTWYYLFKLWSVDRFYEHKSRCAGARTLRIATQGAYKHLIKEKRNANRSPSSAEDLCDH